MPWIFRPANCSPRIPGPWFSSCRSVGVNRLKSPEQELSFVYGSDWLYDLSVSHNLEDYVPWRALSDNEKVKVISRFSFVLVPYRYSRSKPVSMVSNRIRTCDASSVPNPKSAAAVKVMFTCSHFLRPFYLGFPTHYACLGKLFSRFPIFLFRLISSLMHTPIRCKCLH